MTVARALIAFAVLLWLAALGWVASTLVTAPAPAPALRYLAKDGTTALPHERCMGTRVAVGTKVWQRCILDTGSGAAFVRFDLETGTVASAWPADLDLSAHKMVAFAPLPDGGAVAAVPTGHQFEVGDATAVYVLGAEGGFTARGVVPERIIALAVVADHIEAVTRVSPTTARVHRAPLAGGDWQATDRPVLPSLEEAPEGVIQAATHDASGWTLWGLRPQAEGPGGERVRQTADAPWAVEGTEAVAFEPREGLAPPTPLIVHDPSAGGGIAGPHQLDRRSWAIRRLYFDGTTWMPVPRPPAVSAAAAHWSVTDHNVVYDHGVALPHTAWLSFTDAKSDYPELTWLTLGARPFALSRVGQTQLGRGELKAMAGASLALLKDAGPPLIPDTSLARDTLLVPDGAEGWWLLGDDAQFVRVDAQYRRIDSTGVANRFGNLIHDLRVSVVHGGSGIPGTPLTRLAALFAVLMGLPLLLLGSAWRRRRWPVVAAGWVLLAILCAPWFLKFTGPGWL